MDALITGCSSGFGEVIAKTLARTGHQVFATMRSVGGSNAEAAETLRAWAASEGARLQGRRNGRVVYGGEQVPEHGVRGVDQVDVANG